MSEKNQPSLELYGSDISHGEQLPSLLLFDGEIPLEFKFTACMWEIPTYKYNSHS